MVPARRHAAKGCGALVKGVSDTCYGSTSKKDSESALYLLQDVGLDVTPGGGGRRAAQGAWRWCGGSKRGWGEVPNGLHEGRTADAVTCLRRWLALFSSFAWLSVFV